MFFLCGFLRNLFPPLTVFDLHKVSWIHPSGSCIHHRSAALGGTILRSPRVMSGGFRPSEAPETLKGVKIRRNRANFGILIEDFLLCVVSQLGQSPDKRVHAIR